MNDDEAPAKTVLSARQRLLTGVLAFPLLALGAFLILSSALQNVLWPLAGVTLSGIAFYFLIKAAYGYNFMSLDDVAEIDAPALGNDKSPVA